MKGVLLQTAIKLNKSQKKKVLWQRFVRVLGVIVVFCTTYAMILPALTMERDTLCGVEAHTHAEECYGEDGFLICTFPEHEHEAACLVADLDMSADLESEEQWEASLASLSYTGVWSEDVLTVAMSQLGYQESSKNCILTGGTLKGYTRYGEKYGVPYDDWNVLFVRFCLEYGGAEAFPTDNDCDLWIPALMETGLYQTSQEHVPQAGDVVFLDVDQRKDSSETVAVDVDRIGLVAEQIPATDTTPAQIKVIEGDVNGQVEYVIYETEDPAVIGYGVLSEMISADTNQNVSSESTQGSELVQGTEDAEAEESVQNPESVQESEPVSETEDIRDSESVQISKVENQTVFTYTDDSVEMTVYVTCDAGLPAGMAMRVSGLDQEEPQYEAYEAYVIQQLQGDLFDMAGYQLHFYADGEEILLEDAQIVVMLTVSEDAYVLHMDEDVVTEGGSEIDIYESIATEEESEVNTYGAAVTFAIETVSEDGTAETSVQEAAETSEEEAAVNSGQETTEKSGQDTQEVSQITQSLRLIVTLGMERTLAVVSEVETIPDITVQFYANVPAVQYSVKEPEDNQALMIIDTRGNGDGEGGNLPVNGQGYDDPGTENGVMYLHLERTEDTTTENNGDGYTGYGNNYYIVDKEWTLTEVYTADDMTYVAGLNMSHIDKLHENSHYTLAQMWVSYDEGVTWNVYAEKAGDGVKYVIDSLHDVEFTNNEENENTNAVLIRPDTLLRLVYDLDTGTTPVAVNMFDYDISDGYKYNGPGYGFATYDEAEENRQGGSVYMNTNEDGINSEAAFVNGDPDDYKTRFAFGNQNTGVIYQYDKLDGVYINGSNLNCFMYCCFGIVTGYNIATDCLIYAEDVAYQALFNDEAYYRTSVPGKTSYYRNQLSFTRTGDTYVLTAVNADGAINGIEDNNLDKFFVPMKGEPWEPEGFDTDDIIFTNNFWPMDGTTSDSSAGHDMLFGDKYESVDRKYTDGAGNIGNLPDSDDYSAHNSYFGMQFAVEFTLDGEYCGPLEYLFYGDDDMWVFLTELETGETQQICDIGGVHASVGSFTDLWDYIPKDSTSTYVLTFFYTERGASGSSCYMEFTLPQVTSITQNTPETGSVSVSKEAIAESDPDASYEFRFELAATEENSAGLSDKYSYVISDKNGEAVKGEIISGGTFTLNAGENIVISGIPYGLQYTITELLTASDGDWYDVSWTDSGGSSVEGNTVSGVIERNKTHTLTCTNEALGQLEITKTIVGTPTAEVFWLDVYLKDSQGQPVSGVFGTYTFTDGWAAIPITENETIQLTGIPVGTVWSLTEREPDGYGVSYRVDGVETEAPSGTIVHKQTVAVDVVNSLRYSLPITGGGGTGPFILGGLCILTAALMYTFPFQYRRKGRCV